MDDGDNMPRPFARVPLTELRRDHVVVVAMPKDERGYPREALLLLDTDGVPRAFVNRCQHMPIPLDGGSRQFFSSDRLALLCGTHGARYRLNDGYCTAGPCSGTSLQAIDLRIVDSTIELREG